MSLFQDRERAFEQAFVNNEEARFRALALRNRMLGEWAGGRLGLKGAAFADYVHDIATGGIAAAAVDEGLVERIGEDLAGHGVADAHALVRAKMAELLSAAMHKLHVRED